MVASVAIVVPSSIVALAALVGISSIVVSSVSLLSLSHDIRAPLPSICFDTLLETKTGSPVVSTVIGSRTVSTPAGSPPRPSSLFIASTHTPLFPLLSPPSPVVSPSSTLSPDRPWCPHRSLLLPLCPTTLLDAVACPDRLSPRSTVLLTRCWFVALLATLHAGRY